MCVGSFCGDEERMRVIKTCFVTRPAVVIGILVNDFTSIADCIAASAVLMLLLLLMLLSLTQVLLLQSATLLLLW